MIYSRVATGFTISQLLLDFGRTTNLVESSRLRAQAEEENVKAVQSQVLLDVTRAYFSALPDREPAAVGMAVAQGDSIEFVEIFPDHGLFAAYFSLRAINDPWPPADVELDLALPSVATVLLVISSFTFVAALRGLERGDERGMRRWIAASAVLGAVFLAAQIFDYTRLDFAVDSHGYGTMFYAMTGFHALHVLAGLLLMGVLLGRAAQGAYAAGDHSSAHAIGYYWHFVDVVWIGLFAVIYLIR